jgi:cytolysin-activating lysine-acyltransferase
MIMLTNSEPTQASPARSNGSTKLAPSAPAPLPTPNDLRQARMAQNFSHIIGVLMRDQTFRNMRIADLEWLVLPPVMAGQYKLGQAPIEKDATSQRPGNVVIPAAVALWARVSPAMDKQLSEVLDKPLRLAFDQWASGDNIWLMAVAGDQRIVPHFLQQLKATEFKGQTVKMRVRNAEGRFEVKLLVIPA